MGTNYYVRVPGGSKPYARCPESQLIHLGKSSAGWRFLRRADPTWDRFDAVRLWEHRARRGPIEDEYGRPVTLEELEALIQAKQTGRAHADAERPPGIPEELWASLRTSDFTVDGFDFCDREFS